jgi:GH35 family endo-1,4-beta-xylanase
MTFAKFVFLFLSFILILSNETSAQHGTWEVEANKRIQEIRQRDFQIRTIDSDGNPIRGVKVEAVQTGRSFPFGSAINRAILSNEKYQEFFKKHFNWAVLENASKWYSNERKPGRPDYSAADAMYKWCENNNIPVRGHCVFWEPEKWQLDWVKNLEEDELRSVVKRRLVDAITHFKGKFVHWDVNNEMLHGSFFKDRLGADIHPWMYMQAHQIDPDARLFVNEFNILSVDQNFEEVQVDEYVEHIKWLQEQGAPIHGIGIQGHIWHEDILSTPTVLKERLDKIASLNLPIWISEFDTANEDEFKNADILELVFRTSYSHPAVEGIMLWAFWSKLSWRGPNSGLVQADWSLNESGKRFESLMNEWSTKTEGVTDLKGIFASRGFFGNYSVSLETATGTAHNLEFTLIPGKNVQDVTVILPSAE